ncbi:MAG: hypothetical protein H8E25_08665 [Planctomycetes bacterium]|nr:hypothetical protein [Planctomycetota bacterium]
MKSTFFIILALVTSVTFAISCGSSSTSSPSNPDDGSNDGGGDGGGEDLTPHTFATFFLDDDILHSHIAIGTDLLNNGSSTTYFVALQAESNGGIVAAHETNSGDLEFCSGNLGSNRYFLEPQFFELADDVALIYGFDTSSVHSFVTIDSEDGTVISQQEIIGFDTIVSPLQSDGADGFVMVLQDQVGGMQPVLVHLNASGVVDWTKQFEYQVFEGAITEIDIAAVRSNGSSLYVVCSGVLNAQSSIVAMKVDRANGEVLATTLIANGSTDYTLAETFGHGDEISLLVNDSFLGLTHIVGNLFDDNNQWSVALNYLITVRGATDVLSSIDLSTNDFWFEWHSAFNERILLCLNSTTGATEYIQELSDSSGFGSISDIRSSLAMQCDDSSFLLPVTLTDGMVGTPSYATNLLLIDETSHAIVDGIKIPMLLSPKVFSEATSRHYVMGSYVLDSTNPLNRLMAIDVAAGTINVAWEQQLTTATAQNSDFYINSNSERIAIGGQFGLIQDGVFAVIPADGTAASQGSCATTVDSLPTPLLPSFDVPSLSFISYADDISGDVQLTDFDGGAASDSGVAVTNFVFDSISTASVSEGCN